MILGFFDSGLGGGVVRDSFSTLYPDIPMILHMDRAHCPYGGRSGDEIRSLTKVGVDHLWEQGATVIIIACNTATVHALRWLQTEIYPDRHILGVTIPGAEKAIESGHHRVGVLATEATVRMRAYRDRVHLTHDHIEIFEVGAPGLVPLIEAGVVAGPEIDGYLSEYLAHLPPDLDSIILGCTHYPLIAPSIQKVWKNIHPTICPLLIDPGYESAVRFSSWMDRHGYGREKAYE